MHSLSDSQHSPLHCLSHEALFMQRSPVPSPQLDYTKRLTCTQLMPLRMRRHLPQLFTSCSFNTPAFGTVSSPLFCRLVYAACTVFRKICSDLDPTPTAIGCSSLHNTSQYWPRAHPHVRMRFQRCACLCDFSHKPVAFELTHAPSCLPRLQILKEFLLHI